MSAEEVEAKKEPTVVKADCFACRGIRNCNVRGQFGKTDSDEFFSSRIDWYILECRGCDSVFVRTVSTNSEDYDNFYEEDGSTGTTYNETFSYWPALSKRSFPEWMTSAGIDADGIERLDEALLELYKALNNDLFILAGIGIRTSFDVASNLLGIEESLSFEAKLNELESQRRIGHLDKARLNTLVEAGNASAHRGWRPSTDDLNAMMDALEFFVHEAFVVPTRKARTDKKLETISKSVPRKKAKKDLG